MRSWVCIGVAKVSKLCGNECESVSHVFSLGMFSIFYLLFNYKKLVIGCECYDS